MNPRIGLREEVVAGIAAQITTSKRYDTTHAILVRPLDGAFQIIRGAHRTEAARVAGLEELWAWVVDVDDDHTVWDLGVSNKQSQLGTLEIGLHALRVVEIARGRRGFGLAAYAKQMALKPQAISRYRQAAEVYEAVRSQVEFTSRVRDLGEHLAIIHKLDHGKWAGMAKQVHDEHLSVADVKAIVKGLCEPTSGSPEGPDTEGDEHDPSDRFPIEDVSEGLGVAYGDVIDMAKGTKLCTLPARRVFLSLVHDREGVVVGVRVERPDIHPRPHPEGGPDPAGPDARQELLLEEDDQ
jgi:ParB-like chromosome segregation protein Spo0J